MHGHDASHDCLTHFIQPQEPVRLHVCGCGSVDAWVHACDCLTHIQPPRSVRLLCVWCGSVDAWVWMRHGVAIYNLKGFGPHVCGCGSVDAWVWMQLMRPPDPFSSNLKVSEAACVWMRKCKCMGMDAPRLPDPFSSNLKVSEAYVWMRKCDAWVWMRHMRPPDPFSSNLSPVRLHVCVDAESVMHGYGCATCDCPDPFSSNLKVSEAACVDVGVWMHGWDATLPDPFSSTSGQ
jgi:hypothetical protein